MKQFPVSIQLYSLREEVKKFGHDEVLKKVAEYGYPAVELGGLYGKKPAEIRKTLDDLGLKASSCHGELPQKANLAQIVDTAKEFGYCWHITGFGPDSFTSEKDCKKAAETFQTGALALKKVGIKLAIHNHWWEFDKEFNGKYPHQIIMDTAPDVYAQIDTYWAAVGGADVPEIIKKINKRVPLLHIKDGHLKLKQPTDAVMTAVGEGEMEWEPIMSSVNGNVLEWLVVELDQCATDMFEAVRKSLTYLVHNGFGRARS